MARGSTIQLAAMFNWTYIHMIFVRNEWRNALKRMLLKVRVRRDQPTGLLNQQSVASTSPEPQ
jgi:hypothetical protein